MPPQALATRISAETAQIEADLVELRKSTRLTLIATIVAGVLVSLYLAFSLTRIARFAEPVRLGDDTGEIAVAQIHDFIGEASASLRVRSPELVKQGAETIIAAVPGIRAELQGRLSKALREGLKEALQPGDAILIDELKKLPDAKKAVAGAATNAAEAGPLFVRLRAAVVARPDVKKDLAEAQTELQKIRDQLKKLRDNRGLSTGERADRRLVQAVMARIDTGVPLVTEVPANTKSASK